MNTRNIDNPDLHLSIDIQQTDIKTTLEEILGTQLTIITDLLEFDFSKIQSEHWAHLFTCDEMFYPKTLSIYGIEFTLANAQQLAAKLNCQIITDYDPTLAQHQWQMIDTDGQISVVVLEEDVDGNLCLMNNNK